MSTNNIDKLGHMFRIRHPEDPNRWIDLPIIYQTMYQAYKAYCEANDVPEESILDERAYYITLGTLKNIADTLTGQAGSIPLEAGGTGASVSSLDALLAYLGLTTNINDTGAKFPTAETVKDYLDAVATSAEQNIMQLVETRFNSLTTDLSTLGITCGVKDPEQVNPPGVIYIKYSD